MSVAAKGDVRRTAAASAVDAPDSWGLWWDPARVADSPGLAVLPTKLEPPYQRPGIIARPALVGRLRTARTPMVAVIAPAGYGKSTILSQLGEPGDHRLAWLSADARDADPASFIRHIAAAIDRVAPLAPESIARVATPGPSIWLSAVPRVAAALQEHEDVTLVIDDVDRIDRSDAVDVLLTLVDAVRGTARIMVAGRTPGLIPAARLVSRGLLTMFGRDDLALDQAEAGAVLAAAGSPLAPRDVPAFTERTEGWAAGVYLSALASTQPRPAGEAASVVAPDRLVEEFFRAEVLGSLNAEDATLLLHASVLDRLSGPLCDAVLQRSRSGAALDRLERTNLFLIPLDRDRTWFRFHHLLGDFLRAELERVDPVAAVSVRGRAAAWHEANGLPEAALEYAMAAGDEDRAAALTVSLGQVVMNAGRIETVRRWFGWFDDREAGVRHPRLAAYAAMVFALEGDSARAERWADIAARTGAADDPASVDAGLRAISRALLARAGVDEMVADAELAGRVVPEGDPWRVAAVGTLGMARQLQGDVEAADELFQQAVARWNETRVANSAACLALVQLAANALARGERTIAEAYVSKARSILIENGLSENGIAVGVDALDARLAIAHGALERARADLAHAQRLRPRVGYATPWVAIRARLDLIRAHLAMGDGGGARTLMAEVRDILTLRPDMGSQLEERDELAERLRAVRGGEAGASTLTLAELRVLPLLTTHLTFREIGERLFVSQNTVKTQAISIYRKLDATSRSEAIDRAEALGLLESARPGDRFIPAG